MCIVCERHLRSWVEVSSCATRGRHRSDLGRTPSASVRFRTQAAPAPLRNDVRPGRATSERNAAPAFPRTPA